MKIKIDTMLLRNQLNLCDDFAEKIGEDTIVGGLFSGIANLLSDICLAADEGEDIELEVVKEGQYD